MRKSKIILILVAAWLSIGYSACQPPLEPSQRSAIGKSENSSDSSDTVARGKAIKLYGQYCASCHNPLPETDKVNRTAEQITTAIGAVKEMKHLHILTKNQISSIADILKVPIDDNPPETDGRLLYAQNCASCHNTLAQSTKKNKSAVQIKNAITSITEMAHLKSLSHLELDALAAVLKDVTPPSDDKAVRGAQLYQNNCASCHGQLEISSKKGRSVPQVTAAIDSIKDMKYLSYLSDTQINEIVYVLKLEAKKPLIAKPRLANRFLLANRLRNLFVGTYARTYIDNAIHNLVIVRIPEFGGSCIRNDAFCPGGLSLASTYARQPLDPSPNALRRGFTSRVCRRILSADGAVINVLTKLNIPSTNVPTSATIKKFLLLVRQDGSLATPTVISALGNVLSKSRALGHASLDQWRFIMVPVCESLAMEIL